MGNRTYIVDYDIPEEPAREKVQFYRDMKKLLSSSSQKADYSTLSVFRTCDKILAQAVYLLVVAHRGSGHVYAADDITDEFDTAFLKG
jgi:hypothetical protein